MSSTNVHSEQKRNLQLVGGQVIADERENKVVIPPKSAGRSPSSLEVKLGIGIEIPVEESELQQDGKLIAKNGTQVAKFDTKACKIIAAKYKESKQATKSKKTTSKGEDR